MTVLNTLCNIVDSTPQKCTGLKSPFGAQEMVRKRIAQPFLSPLHKLQGFFFAFRKKSASRTHQILLHTATLAPGQAGQRSCEGSQEQL